jgi:hypothetical protein
VYSYHFSNVVPPTNLLLLVTKDGLLDHRSSNPSVTGTFKLHICSEHMEV